MKKETGCEILQECWKQESKQKNNKNKNTTKKKFGLKKIRKRSSTMSE